MTWLEQFAHWVARTTAPVLWTFARRNSIPHVPFSQCMDPVFGCITQDELTAGGVCESVSAFWIVHHSQDSSLWNWLTTATPRTLSVNMGPLWQVMALQREGMRPWANQRAVTDRFLRTNRIVHLYYREVASMFGGRRRLIGGPRPETGTGFRGVFGVSPSAIADAITRDVTMQAGCYKLIGVEGIGGEHTMCAWVAQDVAFFDPNFGEFYFETPAQFRSWFTSYFWIISQYWGGLSGGFDVHSYARELDNR